MLLNTAIVKFSLRFFIVANHQYNNIDGLQLNQ